MLSLLNGVAAWLVLASAVVSRKGTVSTNALA
jgi:hypothetical protein